MTSPAPAVAARIAADIAREARGRDFFDYRIPERVAAGLRRDAIYTARPERPIIAPDGAGIAPDTEGEGSDGFDYWHAAQADFHAVCANQTGRTIPEEVYAEGIARRAEQDAVSVELARALDSTGRFTESPYYRGESDPNRCTVLGIFTGAALPLPAVKRSNVLPSVAKSTRGRMLRDIEHFMLCLPGSDRKAAMFTITNGPRAAIHPVTLREAIRAFHRRLSKLAAHATLKRFGVRMEWRATEFGTPKWDPDSLALTVHIHAHVLVTLPADMTHRRRRVMRKYLWRVFRVRWDDAGDVVNAREFVKYPVKDADLRQIVREGGPGVFADFVEAIRGLHIVQPLGELKRTRATRRASARRIYGLTRDDGRTLEELGDPNAGKRPLAKPSKNRLAYRAAAQEMALRLGTPQAFTAPQIASRHWDQAEAAADFAESPPETPPTGRKSPTPRNRVIAVLAPAPYGSPILEPGVVVWGYDGNPLAVFRQPRVAALRAAHRAAFADGEAAAALIRACAHVPAGAPAPRASDQSSQRSNNCPAGPRPPAPAAPPGPAWRTSDLLEFARN